MYKTLKIPFKHIIKDNNAVEILEDMIKRVTIIVKHTYYFIKLYTIHCFENKPIKFCIFDKAKIRYIYTLVSTIKSNIDVTYEYNDIKKFNDDVFQNIRINKVSRDGLTNVLAYEADIIITCIENNIKNNFTRHFNRFINTITNLNEQIKVADTNDKKILWKIAKNIKSDILSFAPYISNQLYHKNIASIQKELFNKFYDNDNADANGDITSILYDVKKSPQKYLYTFYKILKRYEKINETIIKELIVEKENQKNDENIMNIIKEKKYIKLFNMLPQRTSLIPKHITIDSEILIQNFKEIIKANLHLFPKEIYNVELLRRNFTKYQDILWGLFFNINKKINKNYKFDYLLKTDNSACSLQFALDTGIKKQRFQKKVNKKKEESVSKNIKAHKNVQYIDDALKKNKNILKNKNIVCIDPNKGDLIYAGKYIDNKFVAFRYTNNQRRKEKKTKKYNKIRKDIANGEIIRINNENKNIPEIETLKTKYKKTEINKNKLIKDIEEMAKIDEIIKEHYENTIYRKLNMNSYINTQRSESRMINNFRKKMGEKEETVVIIGDNGLKDVVIKGLESTLSKGLINLFVKNNYETYIIDEFRTSKLCNGCEKELSKFLDIESKKPRSKGKIYKSHGILRCQSSTQTCNVIHNRDKNAVKNMLKLVLNYDLTKERLQRYSRNFSS